MSKPSREITETPAETELTPTGRPIGRQMSDGREIWAQSECVVGLEGLEPERDYELAFQPTL